MMNMLTEEITLDAEQFGGIKGSGTKHMLTELVTDQVGR